mmetsp:Transcript_5905/g.8927  ORF Transcript_5905/g.8927 Transcript_5905/m.8927 type:complete len:272 (-) Transcript_5905:716-1531(-)
MDLADAIFHNLLIGTAKCTLIENSLNQRSFTSFVVVPRTGQSQISKAREFSICGIQEVINSRCLSIRLISTSVHHLYRILHLSHPSVETKLNSCNRDSIQVVDIIKHGVLSKARREYLFDTRNIKSCNDDVKLPELIFRTNLDTRHTNRFSLLVTFVNNITAWGSEINLDITVFKVLDDGIMKTSLGTSLQHSQNTRLGTNGEKHKDGQHSSSRDVITIDESKSVSNRIPHSIQRPTASSKLSEPLSEGDIIQITDHIHTSIEIKQGANNG